MKLRITLLTIGALCYMSLTSCIKNWVCTCDQTITSNGSVVSTEHGVHEFEMSKIDAQRECNELEINEDYGISNSIRTTCTME